MGEIEVNEYVRTNAGYIAKLKQYLNYTGIYLFDNFIQEVQEDRYRWISEIELEKVIVKHSKQLIELVELKDLICFKNKLPNSLEIEKMIIHVFDNDTLEEVKQAIERGEIELLEILTHEQFEQNSYKLGGANKCM